MTALDNNEDQAESTHGNLTRRDAMRGALMVGGLAVGGTTATDAIGQSAVGKPAAAQREVQAGQWISLFDGKTLNGWHSTPRIYGPLYPGAPPMQSPIVSPEHVRQSKLYPAQWSVEDGAIVGQHHPDHPGYGGFLLTDRHFMDFELKFEVNNDWPTDSGISMRKADRDWAGIQVLIDHRPAGGIGGYYGNGLGGFHAVKFAVDAKPDGSGLYVLKPGQNPNGAESMFASVDVVTPENQALLEYFASEEEFLRTWKWKGWNEFTIRSVGKIPQITTHINNVLISKIDLLKIKWPNYDPDEMFSLVGWSGSIALEVHDNAPGTPGDSRWGKGAKCRYRNIRIREL